MPLHDFTSAPMYGIPLYTGIGVSCALLVIEWFFGKLKYFDGTSKWSFPFNGIGAVLNRVYIDNCSTFLLGDIILISFRYIDHHMFTFLIFVTFIYKWLYTITPIRFKSLQIQLCFFLMQLYWKQTGSCCSGDVNDIA